MTPSIIREKYDSLPSHTQNNARSIFRKDWERVKNSPTKKMYFAERWGLPYEHKYTGEASHGIPKIPDEIEEMSEDEKMLLADKYNIY